MTFPKWLLERLETEGRLNNGIGRNARIRTCPTCRATTITGLDADLCALPAVCDPTPLTPQGEAIALIAGRITYAFRMWGGHLQLDHRTSFHIRGGRRDIDVLATHVCHAPRLPSQPSVHQRQPRPRPGTEPPY